MTKCSHTSSCELYAQFSIKASLKVWTMRYCEGEQDACQRHRLFTAGEAVPPNLLPNGKLLKVGQPVAAAAPRPAR